MGNTIEICERVMDSWLDDKGKKQPKFHAQVKGHPGIWACGRSAQEAIGDLVLSHPEVFTTTITHLGKLPR